MNIKRTLSFLIIFSFFIYSCGFTPQYAGFKKLEFGLIVDKFKGDRDLNNEINSQIKRYDRGKEDIKIIKVSYNSKYEKITVAKNAKGQATKYNLKVNINFDLNSENYSEKVLFYDEFKFNKIDDTIEENNFIKIIKRNFAESAVEKLILSIRQEK